MSDQLRWATCNSIVAACDSFLVRYIYCILRERMNRPGFELTPRSWKNFKGLHKKYLTEFKLKVLKSF